MLSEHLKTDFWYFDWTINGYWKFLLFWHLIILNRNELLIRLYKKRLFSNLKIFVIKSTSKTNKFIWNCASTCIYIRVNVAFPNLIEIKTLASLNIYLYGILDSNQVLKNPSLQILTNIFSHYFCSIEGMAGCQVLVKD